MGQEPPLRVKWRKSQLAALEERCGSYGVVEAVKRWLTDEVALHAAQPLRHPLDASIALEDVLARLAERFLPPNLHAKTVLAPRESFADEIRDFVEFLRTGRPARELRFLSRQFAPFGQAQSKSAVRVSLVFEIDRGQYELQVRLIVDPPPTPEDRSPRGGR
jgi:hypothetical protein